MRRLFFRLWLSIVLCLLLELLLVFFLAGPALIFKRLRANIEGAVAGPVGVVADLLARDAAHPQALARTVAGIQERLRMPAALASRTELPLSPEAAERFARGEAVSYGNPPALLFVVALPGTDQVLRIGPVIRNHPLAGWAGAVLLLLIAVGLSLGVYLPLRPLARRFTSFADTVTRLGRRDLTARADTRGKDVLADLARGFNRMADELGRAVEGQRELLHDVSHELRRPLQRLGFGLELLAEDNPALRADGLRSVDREMEALKLLVDELVDYVRLGAPPAEAPPCELRPHLEAVVEQARSPSGPMVEGHLPEGPLIARVEHLLLRRAVDNILANAVFHARSRVRLSVVVAQDSLCIDVDDDGPGIPAGDRERIFEPFQRLESAAQREGSGLGLAIVRRIVRRYGGRAEALDSDLGGARIRLTLPR